MRAANPEMEAPPARVLDVSDGFIVEAEDLTIGEQIG